jgi:hypothetical protein
LISAPQALPSLAAAIPIPAEAIYRVYVHDVHDEDEDEDEDGFLPGDAVFQWYPSSNHLYYSG